MKRKLRAVIYNRCSTEEESQKDALAKQVQESRNCVRKQGWQLVDSYVEAKSGTTSEGRKEYQRLYRDLEEDRFDVIVIKSQDRLMRNTKDWYLFLDRMQKNRKRLYMYLEKKFYTPDDALITGIKAILAEEYSRELSKKINNAHQNRQKEGQSFVFTNHTYGLKKLPDKRVVIDEREAEMVRMIFELSANGYGTYSSARLLFQNGWRNHNGNRISPATIRNIVRNPIYRGTVIQNRQHYDFESRQLIWNPPSEWIIHEDAVPAIVEKELFERANRGLDERKVRSAKKQRSVEQERDEASELCRHSGGKYPLSGKLFCGLCGAPYYRTLRSRSDGKVAEWKCSRYLQNGRKTAGRAHGYDGQRADCENGCDNVHLSEKKLLSRLKALCGEGQTAQEEQKLTEELSDILGRAMDGSRETKRQEELRLSRERAIRQKEVLLEKLLEHVISDADYMRKNEELEEKIRSVEMQLEAIGKAVSGTAGIKGRLESIQRSVKEEILKRAMLEESTERIQRIEVFPEYMKIYRKGGRIPEAGKRSGLSGKEESGGGVVTIPQTCSSSRRQEMEEEKEKILSILGETPKAAAKEVAARMGVSVSLVRRRIKALEEEKRLCYSGLNGRGQWLLAEEKRK